MKTLQKGMGAQSNVPSKFHKLSYVYDDEFTENTAKSILEVFPKTIVNEVKSPDISMEYSLNPYQGCEHGCAYCFARPTHEYWGFSAGIDFERKIMVKQNAPALLETFLSKKNYIPKTIVLSGNTDPYQPVERQFQLTRRLLEIFLKYRHPVSFITKNALILRDLDLLIQLREYNLVSVNFSIPTLNEELRRVMEPRTSTAQKKLNAVEILSENDIPVNVMVAPVIPGLNSDECLDICRLTSDAGAKSAHHVLVRLNDAVEPVFVEWLKAYFPDRSDKVLNLIKDMRGGKLGEKNYFERYKGQGNIAEMIHKTFALAKRKYFDGKMIAPLSTEHFSPPQGKQLSLF